MQEINIRQIYEKRYNTIKKNIEFLKSREYVFPTLVIIQLVYWNEDNNSPNNIFRKGITSLFNSLRLDYNLYVINIGEHETAVDKIKSLLPISESKNKKYIVISKDTVDKLYIMKLLRKKVDRENIIDDGDNFCIAKAVRTVIREMGINLIDKEVVVIGKSNYVGLPIANMLIGYEANVTTFGSKISADNKAHYIQNACIIISCAGADTVSLEDLKDENGLFVANKIFIDVGYRMVDGKPKGDIDESIYATLQNGWYTPVKNGISMLTKIELVDNIVSDKKKYFEV